MPIPVGSCEVWFQFDVAGDAESMFTHLAYDLAAGPDQAAVDAGFTSWQTVWRTRFHSTYVLTGGHVLVGADGGANRWDSSITPVTGNNAGTMSSQQVAVLIRKSTAAAGRRNRGRMFIPGAIESEVDQAGLLTPAAVAAWNSAVLNLRPGNTIHTAFGFLDEPVILHDSGSQTPTAITDLSCQSRVATQRRRLRR
jgi:hypothetical protein